MNEDHLISCLSALCKRFADDPLDGRYEVASRATLSEQYLYQVLAGKTMANGNKRSLGKVARNKISKAFPDWLSAEHRPPTSYTPSTVPALKLREPPPAHSRQLVQQVCDLAERLDDAGLLKLQGFAVCLLDSHALAKPKQTSSA